MKIQMSTPDPRTLAPAPDIPKKHYSYAKNNKPGVCYSVYEVWENGCPDKVADMQKIEFSSRTFCEEQLNILFPFWKETASNAGFKDAILTIQGDIGSGSEPAYGYKDGRKETPPNAQSYTIKPRFDDNIHILRRAWLTDQSLVYSSPLDSPTLRIELLNLNKLLASFFNKEDIRPFVEKRPHDFAFEWIVDNAKLRY